MHAFAEPRGGNQSRTLLGIDTCGATGTLALARVSGEAGTGPEAVESLGLVELAGLTTAAMLIPELKRLLAESAVGLDQLSGLVVVDGPGSFTGIRIGLSAVKGLAEAAGLPVYAISRLRVLAGTHRLACAVLDAGRGEFYCGCYAPPGWCFDPTATDSPGDEIAPASPGIAAAVSTPELQPGEWLLTRDELTARFAPARSTAQVSAASSAHRTLPAPGEGPLQPRATCDNSQRPAVCEEKVFSALPTACMVAAPTALDALRAALSTVIAGTPSDVVSLDGRYLRRSDLYRPMDSQPLQSRDRL